MEKLNLELIRFYQGKNETIGKLMIPGWPEKNEELFTLEPKFRDLEHEEKVPGKTAIPAGTYLMKNLWSISKQTRKWYLDKVPQFTGIMIHAGNTYRDTRGCILLGTQLRHLDDNQSPFVANSVLAVSQFEAFMRDYVFPNSEVYITIKNQFE